MGISEAKTLTLTPEQSSFVDDCIATGRYESASDVVRAGLRLLADEEEARLGAVQTARAMIDAGAQELDRNDVVDGEEAFQRLRAKRNRMRREAES